MVEIDVVYEGDLHCEAVHGPSSSTLATDAPVDNHGRGEAFSPTDLVATALGACMVTIMGIVAQRHEWDISGTRMKIGKEMTTEAPRRIAKISVDISVPAELDEKAVAALEQAAHSCPVRLSILPAIEVPVTFSWGS